MKNCLLRQMWSCKLAVLAVLVLMLATAAWVVARSDGIGGRPLVIVWSYDPGDYDPHHTSHPIAQDVFRYVCEPLFYEDFDGSVHGILAEDEIAYKDGGRRLVVTLREDITFHDGTPLDAQAVQASFERLQRLGASPLINDLRNVKVNAQSDGRSVVFNLPEPDYEFPTLVLSNPYAVIVSPQTGDPQAPGFVACTGPYRFVSDLYHPERSLALVRNSDYLWPSAYFANRGAARISQIRFVFEEDRDARLDALLKGDGCVLSLSKEQEAAVVGLDRFRLHDATGGITYLGFNFQRARWQDVRARQAVALALDKAALAAIGPFSIANTPLVPTATGYDERAIEFGYNYDPNRSQALLAEAGLDTDAEVVLLYPESNTYRELVAVVQQQLEAIGLTIRVREVPRVDILSERQDFDLLLFDYAWGDYTALSIFLGPGPRNLLNYPGDDVADLVAQARVTGDRNARQDLVLEAQRVVLEEVLWQPLLVRRLTFAVDGRCVQGERQSPVGELVFHDANTFPLER
jgi:peptide/nickel transport system substrate-binding protein